MDVCLYLERGGRGKTCVFVFVFLLQALNRCFLILTLKVMEEAALCLVGSEFVCISAAKSSFFSHEKKIFLVGLVCVPRDGAYREWPRTGVYIFSAFKMSHGRSR